MRVAYQQTLDAALRETAALGESMHHEWALRLDAERESTRRQLYDLRQLAEADSRERVQQVWCARSDTGYQTHAAPNTREPRCLISEHRALGCSVGRESGCCGVHRLDDARDDARADAHVWSFGERVRGRWRWMGDPSLSSVGERG